MTKYGSLRRLHADITDIAVRCRYRSIACTRLLSVSVGLRLCLDDVRIWARAVAVEGSDPVVVGHIGSQAGHIPTSRIAHAAILIGGNVGDKGIARGDV